MVTCSAWSLGFRAKQIFVVFVTALCQLRTQLFGVWSELWLPISASTKEKPMFPAKATDHQLRVLRVEFVCRPMDTHFENWREKVVKPVIYYRTHKSRGTANGKD